VTLPGDQGSPAAEVDVTVIHDALDRLTALDERKGRVVELKFFGGLTTPEIAQVLGVSVATVEREWTFARAWLYDAVGPAGP
jgi:RNA polymerase sigma factor (sigma-70 family)